MGRGLWTACLLTGVAIAQQQSNRSVEKEIALGRQLAAEFRIKNETIDSPSAHGYIDGIGRRLAAEAGGPPFHYTFELIASDPAALHEPVAFPGGFIFVPAALILAVQDEDELAAMLAHAIAHTAGRETSRPFFIGGPVPVGMLPSQRAAELAADGLAVRMVAAAAWDPRGFARYIERQPSNDAPRIEAIRGAIAQLPARSYEPRSGLSEIQQEIRRLMPPPKSPPTLVR